MVVVADLLLSAAAWNASPILVREWDRDCNANTALVVFFGGDNTHTRSRVDAAGNELRTCAALTGFLVGGARPERGFFGAEEMKRELAQTGIAEGRLYTERRSFHSLGNIEQLYGFSGIERFERLVFVSDPLHIFRLSFEAAQHAESRAHNISGLFAWPHDDPFAVWWRPHFELAAWLLRAMPYDVYSTVARLMRRQPAS